ncbi:TonB-dependent receptor [Niabella sp. 22666]|uniref:TonB-dependent receptor n=1 Tax=Niabella sp. 22666 TaxID=3453954 RepID=UPI003F85F98D
MLKKIFLFIALVFLSAAIVQAQVTTGSITGMVKSQSGDNLQGANITAIHVPTGSRYSTTSNSSGQYTLPNLRVGGPYTLTVSYAGFKNEEFTELQVGLGSPLVADAVLSMEGKELAGVTVTSVAKGSIISPQRNGASTYVSSRQIQSLPSVNRSVQDFARLTPQVKAGNSGNDGASAGLSFAGQSNRYNQFSIDGANASDAFGLTSSGTNGGAANVNPISLEAVQELQIVLSPYDVTQGGFTGGGINAITKSGTNKFHGAVYGQFQNGSLVGKANSYNSGIAKLKYPDFKNQTFGASIGGPIIKNKLFFYANVERFTKSTPLPFDPSIAGSGSLVSVDTLQKIKDFMQNTYGYDVGSFTAITNENQSTSAFGRIDWNINDKHKLTLRHNYVEGSNDIGSRNTQTAVLFSNSRYRFNTNTNSTVLELNSNFSSSSSNIFRVTYNRVRDFRTTGNVPNISVTSFDNKEIKDPTTGQLRALGNITYNFGSEYSSAANSLDQDIFSITDNFTLYKGNHTMTFGTSNEFFKSGNVFLQGFNGAYTYAPSGNSPMNLTNFFNNTGMSRYQITYSTSGRGDKAVAELKAAQFGLYAQDIWKVTPDFTLTYGLRLDLPAIFSNPMKNATFDSAFANYGVSTAQMPKNRLMFSPRIGFNWDVNGDASLQLRGGAGLFTGRIPFVWISNQFSNTGVATRSIDFNAANITANGVKFAFDPNAGQLGAFIPANPANAATVINVIDKDFKFPQVFRANLAVDKKLGAGFVATVEGIVTKNLNNAYFRNLNVSENGDTTMSIGNTTRPYWRKTSIDTRFNQVIKLENTNEGVSASVTAQVQKMYTKGWMGSIAYTYGFATSLNDLPSSVALSNFHGSATVNSLNQLELTRSNFDMGSRLNGFISKEFKYAKNFATTLTLFYNGQSGQRISYLYAAVSNRSITNADASATSLVYLPKTAEEANFVDLYTTVNNERKISRKASEQWEDYEKFINDNKYFKENAGKVAKRNGDRAPWENHFDFRIAQDFIVKTYKLQVFFDVLNIGNLFNNSWGRAYGTGTNPDGFFPLSTTIFTPVVSNPSATPTTKEGVAFTPTVYKPAYTFNLNNFTDIDGKRRPYNVNNFTSRWSGQIGVRFSF